MSAETYAKRYGSLRDRFFKFVNIIDGKPPANNPALGPCWLWTGTIIKCGYGQFSIRQKMRSAHIVAYELEHGPVPDGLELDHLCRVRACVRPSHLEAVTRRVNVLRGISPAAEHAKKTHCSRGHDLPANRVCAKCQHIRYVKWRDKRAALRSA